MPSNSLWPQFHHALPALFGSRASAVMGCDGCLREVLWENGAWRGPVFAHTMRKEVASSLQTPRTPPSHTQACIPHLLFTFSSKTYLIRKPHSIPLSFLRCFHAFPSSCLCKTLVSQSCWSPSRGILLAAPSRLLLVSHSHAGSLQGGGAGMIESGSQPRKWTRKF